MSNAALFLTATVIWGSTWLGITYQLGVVPPAASANRYATDTSGGTTPSW